MPGGEPLEVLIELRPDVARALDAGSGSDASAARDLTAVLDELGVALESVELTEAPSRGSLFRFEATDLAEAQRIVERLRATGAVEAAWPKPRASLP